MVLVMFTVHSSPDDACMYTLDDTPEALADSWTKAITRKSEAV